MKAKFLAAVLPLVALSACTDAQVASSNIQKSANQFEVMRRIVFLNSITDKYIVSIEGRCTLEVDSYRAMLSVTCKKGEDEYAKHFLGLSDNVTYFAEQIETSNVSAYHYKVVFKPQSIIPDVDLQVSGKALFSAD